jgi:adenylate kinase family enzyme
MINRPGTPGRFFVPGERVLSQHLPIEALGRRIMILGTSNSGKSTLAVALADRLNLPVVHLDQLRHLPNTDWEIRPPAEFKRLHDAAIAEPAWVMEGCYSELMPQRIARASAILVTDAPLTMRYRRYLFRTLFQKERAGALEGGQDRLNRTMLSWLWKSRNAAERYRNIARNAGLPYVFARDAREVEALYTTWRLTRP